MDFALNLFEDDRKSLDILVLVDFVVSIWVILLVFPCRIQQKAVLVFYIHMNARLAALRRELLSSRVPLITA